MQNSEQKPNKCHPLFKGFVGAAFEHAEGGRK